MIAYYEPDGARPPSATLVQPAKTLRVSAIERLRVKPVHETVPQDRATPETAPPRGAPRSTTNAPCSSSSTQRQAGRCPPGALGRLWWAPRFRPHEPPLGLSQHRARENPLGGDRPRAESRWFRGTVVDRVGGWWNGQRVRCAGGVREDQGNGVCAVNSGVRCGVRAE